MNRDGVPALELAGLTVDLGARRILDSVDLTIGAGEFLALCGPNGGGKTTLLKAALGLLTPSAGRVRLLGGAPEKTRTAVGYLPQRKGFTPEVPATAAALITAAATGGWPFRIHRAARERARAALARVGGEHLLDRPLVRLSGGETQRVFLARALVNQPRLLVLDEPTAGVDAQGRRGFLDVLADVTARDGMSTLLVTHSVAAVRRLASRVVYLEQHVRIDGPVEQVLDDPGLPNLALGGKDHVEGWPSLCEED